MRVRPLLGVCSVRFFISNSLWHSSRGIDPFDGSKEGSSMFLFRKSISILFSDSWRSEEWVPSRRSSNSPAWSQKRCWYSLIMFSDNTELWLLQISVFRRDGQHKLRQIELIQISVGQWSIGIEICLQWKWSTWKKSNAMLSCLTTTFDVRNNGGHR